ncbi:MAG: hypothetical protein F2743_08250 [Actinobacteria bacterium]|nr:hypothetical protein [Actinomycetota bacterium]
MTDLELSKNTAIFAPVCMVNGSINIELKLKAVNEMAPITLRLTDLICDPETVSAIYIAWEAMLYRVGAIINRYSVDLSNESYEWLKARKLMMEGDSIAIPAYLALYIQFSNDFINYQQIVATGSIRKTSNGYSADKVSGIKDKFVDINHIPIQIKTAIIVPELNAHELDITHCMHDIWTVGPFLKLHQIHKAD